MSGVVSRSRELVAVQERDGPAAEQVREQLRSILSSPAFHGSKRCQAFLDYVCGRALVGEADQLKERTIATEVFGRRPHSDLSEDTIVRVGAREVRKRLAQYYVTPEGVAARVRIDLPPGSYVPEFRTVESREVVPPAPPVSDEPPSHSRRNWLAVISMTAVAIAAFSALVWKLSPVDGVTRQFERFWAPVLASNESMLLAAGHPLVYHPSLRIQKLNEARLPPPPYPMQRPIQLPPEQVNGSDMVPVANQYVGFGDMVAATEIAGMLGQRAKTVRVRMASDVSFADLRKEPVLLIGALTNRWTMELGQGWRFRFDRRPGQSNVIADTAGGRTWSVPAREDGVIAADYILISRIPNSPTGGLLMIAAGVKQFGTEAAGRLLADPAQLGSLLNKLPEGWENKNLQIVLEAKVIGNTPAQPQVAAWHLW
jgi:hypothetical protein